MDDELPAWVIPLIPRTEAERCQVAREVKVIRHMQELLWRERPAPAVKPLSPERCEARRRALMDFQCDGYSDYRPVIHMEELGEMQ